jgi:hypothetical protein
LITPRWANPGPRPPIKPNQPSWTLK